MKRLFLLRHAQAASTANSDKERPLTDLGVIQAKTLGEKMKAESLMPQAALCSPALRTRQTLESLNEGSGFDLPSSTPDKLYHASPGDLLSFIQNVSPKVDGLLLVNHNPSIHQVAFMLCGSGNEDKVQYIASNYQPCTLSVLDFKTENWKMVSPGEGVLVDVIPPLA